MRFCSLLAFFWWRGHRNQIFFLLRLYLTHRRIKSLHDIYSIGMFNRVLRCSVVLGTTKGLPFHPLQLVSYLCEYWGESQRRPMSKTVVYTPAGTNIYIYNHPVVALPGRGGGNHTLNLCMDTRGGGTPLGSPFLYETQGGTNPPKRRLKHTFLFFIVVLVGVCMRITGVSCKHTFITSVNHF